MDRLGNVIPVRERTPQSFRHRMRNHHETRMNKQPDTGPAPGIPCHACQGTGVSTPGPPHKFCKTCDAVGFFGIDPEKPSTSPRGTPNRVAIYAARYRAGLYSIWNHADESPSDVDRPEPIPPPLETEAIEDHDDESDDTTTDDEPADDCAAARSA